MIQVHGGCFHGEGGQSRWLSSLGAVAPRFKFMEDVSMEREGKAGGGRVSIGSCCVVWCCVCVCLAMYPHICIQFVFGQNILAKPRI